MSRIEAIAESYVTRAGGNPSRALRAAIADALADVNEAERRALSRDPVISHGDARRMDDEGAPLRPLDDRLGE